MQVNPDDDFSFKGVAPDDRPASEGAAGEVAADVPLDVPVEAPAEPQAEAEAMPEPPAPLPAPAPEASVAPASPDLSVVMAGGAEDGAVQASAVAGGKPAQAASSQSMQGSSGGGAAQTPPGFAAEESQAPVNAGRPMKSKVTLEVQGEDPSQGKTVSPRHLVQGWLAQMVKAKASDLILRSGGRPSQRLDGKISFLPGRVPGPGPMLEVLRGILGEKRMETFMDTGAADAALDLDGLGRFRINAYKQMGEPAIVIRRINENAPSLEDLNLPVDALRDLAMRKRGLVLVTGVAGSGKSTTLSAMIEFMNRNVERHVVTLEDPVELMFKERYCVISQREVGTDTVSFKQGIKHALRQSPDVIFIGEMRDAETVLAALEAIETGHLVMSTMHTVNAAQTVDRILGFFPAERHMQIRQRMADTLAGVLSMRLVPRVGGGQVPAFELMQVTPQVRELLEEGKTTELGRVIQSGTEKGIISFNDRLFELVQTGFVTMEDAIQTSDRPDELIMMIRGIQGGQRAAAKAQAGPKEGQPQRRRTDDESASADAPAAGAPAPAPGQKPSGKSGSGGSNLRLRGNNGY